MKENKHKWVSKETDTIILNRPTFHLRYICCFDFFALMFKISKALIKFCG